MHGEVVDLLSARVQQEPSLRCQDYMDGDTVHSKID